MAKNSSDGSPMEQIIEANVNCDVMEPYLLWQFFAWEPAMHFQKKGHLCCKLQKSSDRPIWLHKNASNNKAKMPNDKMLLTAFIERDWMPIPPSASSASASMRTQTQNSAHTQINEQIHILAENNFVPVKWSK
jgi:hypothetical protein